MKIAVIAAAGLAVGLLGGAGLTAVKARGQALEAHAAEHARTGRQDTGAPESGQARPATSGGDAGAVAVTLPAETDPATADSTPEVPVQTLDSAHMAESDPTTAEGGDAGADVAPAMDSTDAPARSASEAAAAEPALDPAGAKKLAKIFGAMKPADAASVLAEMTDEEITAVLLQMNDRLAAPIVGALPPARAAALSQNVLRDREGGS